MNRKLRGIYMALLLLILAGSSAIGAKAYYSQTLEMGKWLGSDTVRSEDGIDIYPDETGAVDITFRNIKYTNDVTQLKVAVWEYSKDSSGEYQRDNIYLDNLKVKASTGKLRVNFHKEAFYEITTYVADYNGGNISFDVKAKYAPKTKAKALKVPSKFTVSTGRKGKMDVRPKDIMIGYVPKIKWKTSNSRVATVNTSGEVSGKKKGTCTVYCIYNKKKYTCTVTVKDNTFVSKAKYDVADFPYADPGIVLTRAYYDKKNLVVKCRVYNNRMFKVTSIDKIKFEVYNAEKKDYTKTYRLAARTFKNLKVNVPPYSSREITLRFPIKTVKELRTSDLWIEYGRFLYNYVR